ncbi:RNA polymerase sigma factor [Streptomyces sp. NPDC088387]|uniref:RNA polymerase sigma factor n=1 Tax=Streptomyces sp. NPDC088387 TaxID=3365859 RepID=UPI0037F7DDB0
MEGEPDGYTVFFEDQYPRVVAMLIAYRGFAPEVAEDSAAEAMCRLLLNWGKVEMPQAWVRTVALRVACRLAKNQQAGPLKWDLVDERAAADLAAVETSLVAGSAVAALPRRQQEVMTLTLVDMTPSEIAVVLGCTAEQARGNLAHARRALRNAIQREEGADGPDAQRAQGV